MFAIVWRFEIDPTRREDFERSYGPEGAWASLFRMGRGFLGTELFRSTSEPDEYLTVDRWESEGEFRAFRREHAGPYEELDREMERLTVREEKLAG